jgi:hypothetical protein
VEAARTKDASLLPRDGAVPATPPLTVDPEAATTDPIDGVVRCCCCGRFPLLGERIVHHQGPERSGWVCATCESEGRCDDLGPVDRSARVRSLGGAMNVRRIA